jgi:hypothetical protein
MPPTKLSLANERAERLLALEGMGTVEQKSGGGYSEPVTTGQATASYRTAALLSHQPCTLKSCNTFWREILLSLLYKGKN